MTQMINRTDMNVLEFAKSGTADSVFKNNLSYDAIRSIVARYLGKKSDRNTVDYLEVLEINDLFRKKYLKIFLVIVSTRVAGETRILALQYRKKPLLLNIVNQLRKTLKGFVNVAKEVFDPQIETESRKEMAGQTEIKEWMR